jgi:hypothetical protein
MITIKLSLRFSLFWDITQRGLAVRRCPYVDVVVVLVWSHIILKAMLAVVYATGRAYHARQVNGYDPDKKGYPGPPGWGFGVGLTTPHSKKNCYESRAKE